MANKKIIIIGGGIAGLCTGVYLRKCGFETEILEMHTISGGLATAWKKGGFTFENCIHWLVGSKDGGPMNAAWKEVFDISQLEFYEDPVFQVLEHGADKIVIYRDPDRLESELLAKAPEDAATIKEFVGLIRKFSKFRLPEGDSFMSNLGAYIAMLPYLPALAKYKKLSMADYSKKFKNPQAGGDRRKQSKRNPGGRSRRLSDNCHFDRMTIYCLTAYREPGQGISQPNRRNSSTTLRSSSFVSARNALTRNGFVPLSPLVYQMKNL